MDITNKIDAVTKIGKDRIEAGGIQPVPKSVKIEITSKCNLRCKYCSLRTRKPIPKKNNMDLDYFKAITTDMKKSGVEEIGLFYLGESFTTPDLLIECAKWCKQELQFPWVFLTSNGTKAYPDVVLALMDAGLDSLKWSLNSWSPKQFKEVTGGSKKNFEDIADNLRKTFAIREKYGFKTILSASSIMYDEEQVRNINKYLYREKIDNFIDRHYWLPMYQMSMHREEVQKKLGYVPTMANTGRIDPLTMKPNRDPLPCWALFTEGHVRVDGGLSACCFACDGTFDMGNLDGDNFMKEWNSPEFQALRETHIRTLTDGPKILLDTPCRVCVGDGGN